MIIVIRMIRKSKFYEQTFTRNTQVLEPLVQ